MFTIEVKKREKDEEFSFEDLEMFHQECGGGKIEVRNRDKGWRDFICKRCEVSECKISPENALKIIQTAIDGKKRRLGIWIEEYDIYVIQKTEI